MGSQGGIIGLPIAIEPFPGVLRYLFAAAFIKICIHKQENVAKRKTEGEM